MGWIPKDKYYGHCIWSVYSGEEKWEDDQTYNRVLDSFDSLC